MSGLFRRDKYIHVKGASEEEKTSDKLKIISRLTEKKAGKREEKTEDK